MYFSYSSYYNRYYESSCIIVISGCLFINNTSEFTASAIYGSGENVSVLVHHSTFINNTSSGSGGAINFNGRYSDFIVTRSIFIHNSASHCGALIISNDKDHNTTSISESVFYYNRAVNPANTGGGVACIRNSSISIFNCTFIANTAAGNGGVIVFDNSTILINNTIFSNNTAGYDGGALISYIHPSNYTITHSSFTHNQAGDDGGAVFIGQRGSYVRVERCTFSINHATDRGGAITIFGSTIEIRETNMYDNSADLGEAISSCNSNVITSIPGRSDVKFSSCSYYDAALTYTILTSHQHYKTTRTSPF